MFKKLAKRYVRAKLHTDKINATLIKLTKTDQPNIHTKSIPHRVTCVQREIKPVKNINDFILSMFLIVKSSVENGATYIIFPEYNFLDLFGIIPGFSFINNYLNKRVQRNNTKDTKQNDSSQLRFLFELFSIPSEAAIHQMMTYFAKYFKVYIYTGSYIHKRQNKLYNQGALIVPDGEVIIRQGKVHLTDLESSMKFGREASFQASELPIGKVACPVCMDASYFETFKLLEKLGTDIVIMPIANNEKYNKWRALRGIWPRVQEAYMYGLKSSLNGWIGGIQFTGKAGVFAPISMTKNKDGVIAISQNSEGNELVFADLDLLQLSKARLGAEYYGDTNPLFEADYFEKTYSQ